MVPRSILPVTAIFLAVSSVHAGRNDWSKACHSGECSYDIKGQTSGSISIAGSPHAISDITSAGGWAIIDCNPDTRVQDIRVVCSNAKCNHLYGGHGAVNTIVRLPENCTDAPFARVAKEWKHSNQSIPDHIMAKITKRQLAASVRGLTLDTNFSAVDANVTGDVTFSIEGTSQSGDSGNFTVTPAISSRGFFSSLNTIHFDKNFAFPIKYDKSVTLFDQSISCPQTGDIPAFNGDLKIVGETSADASLSFAVAATGKIIPPKLTDFGLVAQVDGKIDGVITVNASAAGTITIAKKTLLSVGVPGLSVAGILDIGPAFEVSALGDANLDAQANFGVTLAYNVDGAKLTFPPSVGASSGSFSPGDMSVSVAATPNVAVDGDVEAHLIPAATFGINAFDGDAQANINLSLDTFGKLTLSLKAGSLDSGSAGTSGESGSASGSFSGCAEIDAGLAVTGGADAHLFDIFDKSVSVTLFQKDFSVLDKCFSGSGSTKKSSIAKKRKHVRDISKRGLTCPSVAGSVANVASQVVPSADISPK